MDMIVKEICHPSGWLRVRIVKRTRGYFSIEEDYWSDHPLERSWCSVSQPSFGIFEDALAAEKEARNRIEWLRDSQG